MPRAAIFVLLLAMSSASSCTFVALRQNVERIERFATVGGTVDSGAPVGTVAVVVLLGADTDEPVDSFVLGTRGKYFFVTPAGAYRVAAFADANGDFRYDPATERGAWYGAPDVIEASEGQTLDDVDISISAPRAVALKISLTPPELGRRGIHDLPDVNIGTVTSIDDPRFSPENGKLGMWQPVDFALGKLPGIYFLEPYDADKTPVLFVHGIAGNPGDFAKLISRLDRRHFQPWLLYYPSGVRLDLLGGITIRWLGALAARYRVEHVVIVAHSMGGLVSRSAINQWMESVGTQRFMRLDAYITVSTPWGGHSAAEQGVEHAPVVVPAWYDMAPGSEFLTNLFQTRLPPECRYYLFFGFEGGSMLAREANDGVVAVASELAPQAQEDAVKIYGLPESHMGILRSEAASERLNRILSDVRD